MNPSSVPAPAALELHAFVCGPLQTNAYLLLDSAAREMTIVDPSVQSDAAFALAQSLRAQGVALAAIWNTHGHFDHVYDNARWKKEFGAPLLAHRGDEFFLEHLREQSLWFGLEAPEVALPDLWIEDGQTLRVGGYEAKVWELPGHSPGSVGFLFDDFLIGGDVLFQGSVGRTDLPGASPSQLAASLRRLWTLPPQTRVLTGHGDATTIGQEKQSNAVARQLLAQNP